MLDSIIYLLKPSLIGKYWLGECELHDVGCPERARSLQDQDIAFVVADAAEWAAYLAKLNRQGEHDVEVEQFLNRVRSFPLDMRTPEWEELIKVLNALSIFQDEKPKKTKTTKTKSKIKITGGLLPGDKKVGE
jgi:hypothetical protein